MPPVFSNRRPSFDICATAGGSGDGSARAVRAERAWGRGAWGVGTGVRGEVSGVGGTTWRSVTARSVRGAYYLHRLHCRPGAVQPLPTSGRGGSTGWVSRYSCSCSRLLPFSKLCPGLRSRGAKAVMQALGSELVRSAYRSLSLGSMAAQWYFISTTCKQDGSLWRKHGRIQNSHPEVLDPFIYRFEAACL